MRVLVLFAHPSELSFHAALKQTIIAALAPRHEIDLLDLYAESFDPVLSRAERIGYHDLANNKAAMADEIARVTRAEALVLCFPTWIFGPPAILKGFFDRVFLPGVAFHLPPGGKVSPALTNIRKIAGVVTYGQTRLVTAMMGDYSRHLVTRYLPRTTGGAKTIYLPKYDMNNATPAGRTHFIGRVHRAMAEF